MASPPSGPAALVAIDETGRLRFGHRVPGSIGRTEAIERVVAVYVGLERDRRRLPRSSMPVSVTSTPGDPRLADVEHAVVVEIVEDGPGDRRRANSPKL